MAGEKLTFTDLKSRTKEVVELFQDYRTTFNWSMWTEGGFLLYHNPRNDKGDTLIFSLVEKKDVKLKMIGPIRSIFKIPMTGFCMLFSEHQTLESRYEQLCQIVTNDLRPQFMIRFNVTEKPRYYFDDNDKPMWIGTGILISPTKETPQFTLYSFDHAEPGNVTLDEDDKSANKKQKVNIPG